MERVREVYERHPFIKVMTVAGPGEPLFNPETFQSFELLLKKFYSKFHHCLSTNGLLLPEKPDALKELEVGNITVTMNAVDPEIVEKIYSFIFYHGRILKGRETAKVFLKNQLEGIAGAVERVIIVKVNVVFIPTINEDHIIEVAKKAKELGVCLLNIMPLIPQYKFAYLPPPSAEERRDIQDECSRVIAQMRHCRQCRADAVGLISQDLSRNIYRAMSSRSPHEIVKKAEKVSSEGKKVVMTTTGERAWWIFTSVMSWSFSSMRWIHRTLRWGFWRGGRSRMNFARVEKNVKPQRDRKMLLVSIMNLIRDCSVGISYWGRLGPPRRDG